MQYNIRDVKIQLHSVSDIKMPLLCRSTTKRKSLKITFFNSYPLLKAGRLN